MQQYKKIITHSGAFHGDEVLAIILLRRLGISPSVERKHEVSEEELNDPQILVLDIGRRFEPELGNFDHHQDSSLEATCMLVLQHFVRDEKLKKILAKKLFRHTSDVDCGRMKDGDKNTPFFSAIIGNLRNLSDGFSVALFMTQPILEGYIKNAEKAIEGVVKWKSLKIGKGGRFKIQEDATYIPDWEEIAAQEGVCLYLKPNTRIPGSFQLLADTNVLRIPAKNTQLFLHNSGHLAVYASSEDAIAHAEEILASMA